MQQFNKVGQATNNPGIFAVKGGIFSPVINDVDSIKNVQFFKIDEVVKRIVKMHKMPFYRKTGSVEEPLSKPVYRWATINWVDKDNQFEITKLRIILKLKIKHITTNDEYTPIEYVMGHKARLDRLVPINVP